MPRWSSSVVPEGALMRQMEAGQLTTRRYAAPTSGIVGEGEGDAGGAVGGTAPAAATNFGRFMAQHAEQNKATANSHLKAGALRTGQQAHFLNNPDFNDDPKTKNMPARALAANGTFGTANPIPNHVRSVVATLRRNVEELRRFAVEVPILTSAETPSALKRLAALLFAQSTAVDDLITFASAELRYASQRFFDLMTQLEETTASRPSAPLIISAHLTTTAAAERQQQQQEQAQASSPTADKECFFADPGRPVPPEVLRALSGDRPPSSRRSKNKSSNSNNSSTSPEPVTISDTLRETNAFRSLYTMLAGVANITGAMEGRLFLFPSVGLLGQDELLADALAQQDQSAAAAAASGGDGDADPGVGGAGAGATTPMLDARKLYLVAQVQAQPFAPTRSATAPRDIVNIAEAVAASRCAANLTPGVSRVRASFTSLIAVPLFVSHQQSGVLGVLVLTNKRSVGHHHSHDDDNHHQQQHSTDAPDSSVQSPTGTHFENSASSDTWKTRGFYSDDEHRAVVAAEMMAWMVENLPLAVTLRGACRMSPAGFAAEWSRWACRAGPAALAERKRQQQQQQQQSNNDGGAAAADAPPLRIPVLDADAALNPRRRFVFRTEDPREIAAQGALQLEGTLGKAAKNLSKTRSVIQPASGEYLLSVSHSHRRLEQANQRLRDQLEDMRQRLADGQRLLAKEEQARRAAEDAAHSMMVATDRVLRRSIFVNNSTATIATPAATARPPSVLQHQQQQQQTASTSRPVSRGSPTFKDSGAAPRPPSSQQQPPSASAAATAAIPPQQDAALCDLIDAYRAVSTPFAHSANSGGFKAPHSATGGGSRPSSRPSSRGSDGGHMAHSHNSGVGAPIDAQQQRPPSAERPSSTAGGLAMQAATLQQAQNAFASHRQLMAAVSTLSPTESSRVLPRAPQPSGDTAPPPPRRQPAVARPNMSRRF